MENSKKKNLTKVLFCIYFFILVWILLFKMSFSLDELYGHRNINLIPYYGSAYVNGRVYMTEIINNILVFVPVGIYVSMIKEDWSILKKISVSFISNEKFISQLIEFLSKELDIIKCSVERKENNKAVGCFWFGVENCYKLFKYMYEDSNIFLDRKFKKFDSIFCLN